MSEAVRHEIWPCWKELTLPFCKEGKKKKKKQVSGKPSGRGGRSQGLNEVLRAIK